MRRAQLLPRRSSRPEATYFIGGIGIGVPPMPNTFIGGIGIGVPPMPATLARIETLLNTTNNASNNAREKFFMDSHPIRFSIATATWARAYAINYWKSIYFFTLLLRYNFGQA
jgi:hypothetical protein